MWLSEGDVRVDLIGVLRKAFDCVCGGGRCGRLSLEYMAKDNKFWVIVDEDSLNSGVFGGSFGVYGPGTLTKYKDYYEFRSFERDEYGTGFNVHRLSEDEVRFLVEGVEALALCSPDLRYLLDWSEWVLGVVYDVVYLAERVGLEDGFEVDYGFCYSSVGSEEGWLYLYLLCDWAGDKMDVEVLREEGKAAVGFGRGYGHARVLININADGERNIIIYSDGEALTQFYKDMRNKVEKRTDEILGTLKKLGRMLSLKLLFP